MQSTRKPVGALVRRASSAGAGRGNWRRISRSAGSLIMGRSCRLGSGIGEPAALRAVGGPATRIQPGPDIGAERGEALREMVQQRAGLARLVEMDERFRQIQQADL